MQDLFAKLLKNRKEIKKENGGNEMKNDKLTQSEFKRMLLEDEIADYHMASIRVDRSHWLSQYYERQRQEKIKEWEKLTGRNYVNKGY